MTSENTAAPIDRQEQAHSTFIKEPVMAIALFGLLISTLLIGFSLYWNVKNIKDEIGLLMTEQARNNWNKDQAFRGWASKHGGLYVKVDERTPPNPYLSHLPNRDIISSDGTQLTLMNPAYMMRQMTEEYEENYGIKGSITGKIVLNPINVADEWERKALERFEQGIKEVAEFTDIGSKRHLRLMRPMVMRESCVKCHGHLGFKVGDIRGGVSVSIPVEPYDIATAATIRSMMATHAGVWILGIGIAFIFGRSANSRNEERLKHHETLNNYREDLEKQVIHRTKELKQKERDAKENEERLSKIMNTAVDSIITIDEHGIIESFNDASETIFGYSALEVIGENVSNLMNLADAKIHDQCISRYVNTREAKVIGAGREVKARRKDGSEFWVNLAISELKLESGIVFTGILRDITELKESEKALLQAKEAAESANRAKSEFLSSMSHELRTPLNAILGFSQLLKMNTDKPLDKKQENAINDIIQGGNHLLVLIDDVLDLAKIEAGRAELDLHDIQIEDIIDQSFSLIQPMAADNAITLKKELNCSASLTVHADCTRTKQVLMNLLSNAIKYNQPEGSVTVSCHASSKDVLRIEVVDTGKGIPKGKQRELFKPFSRLGAEMSNVQGTGIGLSVCKNLVELMEGRIGFQSKGDAGSCFWFELPRGENKSAVILNSATIPMAQATRTQPCTINASLLYVEDNEPNIRLMEAICASIEGLKLTTVNSAEEGVRIAKAYIPDIIILDINLPGMSGIDAVELVRQSPEAADIPVIGLSASAMQSDIERGLSAGFSRYITKPVQIENFIDVVEELLKCNG